jgi:hypothetical protein
VKNTIEVKKHSRLEKEAEQETAREPLTLCRDSSSVTHRVRDDQGTMGQELRVQVALRRVPRSAEGWGL